MTVDAVILAGGQGRRMGGRDKGLVSFNGRPLIEWVIHALSQQSVPVNHLLISANRHLPDYARFGYPVLRDVHPDFSGPLAGIHAAMLASPADILLVVPCDVPALPPDLLERLLNALNESGANAAVAQSSNGQIHPTLCMLRREVVGSLIERLKRQQLKLGDWLESLAPVFVEFPDATFPNLNTMDDLEAHQHGDNGGTLTHFDASGQAHMVGVGAKLETHRMARACGEIRMLPATLQLIEAGNHKKGDVLGIARIAGIMGAKRTPDLIPLCHSIALTRVTVDFRMDRGSCSVHCEATAETVGRTGVEMEALTAVQVALLTIYDMCKAVDRGMVMTGIKLVEKVGGKSGHWRAE
ncbi:hypothetical protein JCM19000A_29760 [Silvimonas sp. JCM 19000]